MPVIIVSDEKTAKSVKAGEAYVIDVFPPAEQEDQEISQEMLDLADKLEQIIVNNTNEPAPEPRPEIPSKSKLNKMKEIDVVKMAVALGIDASVDDKKSDTIKKIIELGA